jgi:hypothetical protein
MGAGHDTTDLREEGALLCLQSSLERKKKNKEVTVVRLAVASQLSGALIDPEQERPHPE